MILSARPARPHPPLSRGLQFSIVLTPIMLSSVFSTLVSDSHNSIMLRSESVSFDGDVSARHQEGEGSPVGSSRPGFVGIERTTSAPRTSTAPVPVGLDDGRRTGDDPPPPAQGQQFPWTAATPTAQLPFCSWFNLQTLLWEESVRPRSWHVDGTPVLEAANTSTLAPVDQDVVGPDALELAALQLLEFSGLPYVLNAGSVLKAVRGGHLGLQWNDDNDVVLVEQ